MSYTIVIPPGAANPDNPAWHEARRAGVSASEIAAVLGISPWESAFSLYWRKVNGWEVEGNEEMSTGRYCEPAIADWAADAIDPNENLVLAPAGLYASTERPWQLATPDRLVHMACPDCEGAGTYTSGRLVFECPDCQGKGGPLLAVLDCKWTARWDGWGDEGSDDIPVYYRAQLLWQCDTLGVDDWFLPMLGPGGFRLYRGRRDDADLAVMRAEGETFARRLADLDPPDIDSHTATLGTLKRLHPDVEDVDVEIPAAVAAEYDTARAAADEADARKKLAEARIREALGKGRRAVLASGEKVATRSVYTQRRVDVEALRADHPEIAEKVTVVSTVDKLMPARRKKAQS